MGPPLVDGVLIMNTVVQIGRSYKEWWFVLLIVATACLAVAAGLLFAAKDDAAVTLSMAAAAAGFSVCMSAFVISRSRFQFVVLKDGFLIRDRRGERKFADDQVICASFSSRPNYDNGVLKAMTRTFDLWVDRDAHVEGDNHTDGATRAERAKLTNRLAVGASDPLAMFIERVQLRLYEQANAALAAGQPFEGEDWTLHQEELIVRKGRQTHGVRFDALAAAEIFDNHLCVWQTGQDEPVLRIPASAANTWILLRLLQERIAKGPETGLPPTGDELGRLLFERKPGRLTKALLWLFPLACLVILVVIVLLAVFKPVPGVLLGGLPACFFALLLWVFFISHAVEFRAHEHGVRRKWLFGTQQLKYADVDVFTYSAVRQYVKGVYSGTNFTLTFTSQATGNSRNKLRTLTYSKQLRNSDPGLDHVRDHVSQLIAQRMAQQLAGGRAVVWTDGLRFLPEGLEYSAKGLFGRKPPIMIPYSQIHGYDAETGTFYLWVYGKKKPEAKESVARANFFPGYLLLARLLANRPSASLTQLAASEK